MEKHKHINISIILELTLQLFAQFAAKLLIEKKSFAIPVNKLIKLIKQKPLGLDVLYTVIIDMIAHLSFLLRAILINLILS